MILMSNAMMGAAGHQAGGSGSFLSTYPGAAAAYSLRDLSGAGGAVVRVRRSSDNAEADFTADEINNGTLLTWCGSASGLVITLYDQSGNDWHLSAYLITDAARVVTNGVLEMQAGFPAIALTGNNNQYYESTRLTGALAELTVLGVCNNSATGATRLCGVVENGTTSNKSTFAQSFDNTLRFDGASASGVLALSVDNKIRVSTKNGNAVSDHINGAQNISTTIALNTGGLLNIGNTANIKNQPFRGKFFEAVLWFDDLSADRSAMFADVNDYYGFY